MSELLPYEKIEGRIFQIRGKNVMIDRDLAELYAVPTKALNQAVRRNLKRFPADFMLILTETEKRELVTNCDRFPGLKHSTALPYAFTEQGVAMLSSVLNSELAIQVNIQIMRVFAKMKRVALTYVAIKRKIDELEKKYDAQFGIVFEAIRRLMEPPPEKPKPKIGFHP